MKLSIIFPIFNQVDLSKTCYAEIIKNISNIEDVEIIVVDNGSDIPLSQVDFPKAKIVRNNINIGVYPVFKQGMEITKGDIVAFLHSDVVIWKKGWNVRLMDYFKVHDLFSPEKKLGLVGFIGSNEIGADGGRGGGTASNFQGREITDGVKVWKGSDWTHHGKHLVGPMGFMKGAVLDGCVMILSREAWNKIGYREDFPPHHFYDRLISTQMLEAGFDIGVLGIEFDHISGQTVNVEKGYQKMAWEWLNKNYGIISFDPIHNYDIYIYEIAEKMWLHEYRDTKHLIPIKI